MKSRTRTPRSEANASAGPRKSESHPPNRQKFFFNGMEFSCPDGAYLPSDDSFLLSQSIRTSKGCLAIDVGCGSGILSLSLLFGGAQKVICLDINEGALDTTKMNCGAAGFAGRIETRKSDLFENCPESADIIVFNPPYVPSIGIKFSDLDGGIGGREVLDRFLGQFPKHLAPGGTCYFLQTDLNGYAQTERLLKKLGPGFEIVAAKRIFFEELCIYRCWRK